MKVGVDIVESKLAKHVWPRSCVTFKLWSKASAVEVTEKKECWWREPIVYSKNSGMNFIPKEYDVHTRWFHTHGMNSASMTFILFHSMRFIPRMRKYVRHTESKYKLHTALYTDAESMAFIPNWGMNFTPRYLQIQEYSLDWCMLATWVRGRDRGEDGRRRRGRRTERKSKKWREGRMGIRKE